jgi:hypothetical protein
MNASSEVVAFTPSYFEGALKWESILDTFDDRRVGRIDQGREPFPDCIHSLAVFTMQKGSVERRS